MTTKTALTNGLSSAVIFILALACGSIVANLYYAQTLVEVIGNYLGISAESCGFIVTITQIGYVCGLLFIVPLSDMLENKRLILGLLCLVFVFLLGLITTHSGMIFLVCCFMIGLTAVATQIIIPLVAHLTPLETRGKAIGNVMSGLLLGIMLSRPAASWVSHAFGWQYIFVFSATLMLIIIILLFFFLPARVPEHCTSYKKLIQSLPSILATYPVLRRRAIYQAALFGIFSLFWTSIAWLLMGDYYHYSQAVVALFAFVGAVGALVAPIAGRIADSGYTRIGTGVAILIVGISCLFANWHGGHNIIMLVIVAVMLDIGVTLSLVLGQRAIYSLAPEVRGRLNGLYMASFFTGGAIGSGVSGYLYVHGGWEYIANAGVIVSIVVFVYYLGEYFRAVTK